MKRWEIVEEIVAERESQPPFNDDFNREGMWVSYIVNYASRWAMPYTFPAHKYTFRVCMVKAAALCLAAIEWFDRDVGPDGPSDTRLVKIVADIERTD